LVVAQAVPVLRATAADPEAGGLKAIADDAVADVRVYPGEKEDQSYASMAEPQPEDDEADEVAAVEVVDCAAAKLATARTMAAVYCIVMVTDMFL